MPVYVTVTLDSGSFLPVPQLITTEGETVSPKPKTIPYCEIGYFECEPAVSDIKIFIDGNEPDDIPNPFKLCDAGQKCAIEVRHNDKAGYTKTDGVITSTTFHDHLLHFKWLYGRHEAVEPANFDCVIRFASGHFRASMVKKRVFKEHKKQPDGLYKHDPDDKPTTPDQPIAHNVVVYFTLADGEALELARDGVPFWTSKDRTINERLEIEIAADNSTAEKFFRTALKDGTKTGYFMPNQGDPPPTCPYPPCPDTL